MEKNAKIYVAGHKGLVGSAIVRRLGEEGFSNLILRDRSQVDLCAQAAVDAFFEAERPDYVFLAAAKVGGIAANDRFPADFIRDNLQIQTNVIDAARRNGVTKLAFLGSSCIYPKLSEQPIREDYLLTGALEPTNEWYAIAKIAGIKLCQAYQRQYGFRAISLMPTNLYGPGDNFDLETSHVLPALMRKLHDAKVAGSPTVEVWGSGTPRREFLHVEDLADAALFLMQNYESPEVINVGCGEDITIRGLAELLREVVGYEGDLVFDASRPDGTPRKLLDVSRINGEGWRAGTSLANGVRSTYAWYLAQSSDA